MCARCGKRRCPLTAESVREYGATRVCYCTGVAENFRVFLDIPSEAVESEVSAIAEELWEMELEDQRATRATGPLTLDRLEWPYGGAWTLSGPAIRRG
jgi:hypothetical protein